MSLLIFKMTCKVVPGVTYRFFLILLHLSFGGREGATLEKPENIDAARPEGNHNVVVLTIRHLRGEEM